MSNPKTFNEKLQWLKLYDHNPKYSIMVDKYLAKEYVASIIGKEFIIPSLGIWDSFDEIDFAKLPNRFVLKCTHDSGGVVICKDKTLFKEDEARKKLQRSLSTDYYLYGREWPYKNVIHRIIAEEYMEDSDTNELRDYKFFCFNGVAKVFKIDFNRDIEHQANYYDCSGKLLKVGEKVCPPNFDITINIPNCISVMKKLAEKISNNIPFCRVDFYYANGKIYFGEITFYPASGFGEFLPKDFDEVLGNYLILPRLER